MGFDAVVFAGGGCRCFWQAGFWSVVAPALELRPRSITGASATALRPMVVTGRVHPLTAWLAGRSLRTRWLALPNLVAGAEIVPERLQTEAEPERLAEALEPLFEGPLRERTIAALGSTRARLDAADPAAGEGASERVARIVEEMLEHPGA